jgi:hypothetical protein
MELDTETGPQWGTAISRFQRGGDVLTKKSRPIPVATIPGFRLPFSLLADIGKRRVDGKSLRQVGRECGVAHSTVCKLGKRLMIGKPTTNRGEKHWAAKLTAQDVLDIRARIERGGPRGLLARIAEDYGVHEHYIGHIKYRRRWKHI